MSTDFLEFHLSDNEQVVRTYQCTRLKKWFAKSVLGFLTVTNKRVVYHSQADYFNDKSAVISEIPVQDISGIGASISSSINWLAFAFFAFGVFFATQLARELLPRFLTGWGFALLLILPYAISWLFEKQILNQEVKLQIIQNLRESLFGESLVNQSADFYMNIFRVLFFIGVSLLAWNVVWDIVPYSAEAMAFLLLGGVYFLIYIMVFGRLRRFSLLIHAKSSKNASLVIR